MQADQALVRPRIAHGETPVPPARARPALAAASTQRVQLSVHHDLAALEQEWRSFEQRADCTVFQCVDWLATWQRCVGDRTGVRPAVVIGRDGRGTILFILPLATRRAGLLTRLTFLGRELCDYNAPLLAPEFDQAIGADFASLWAEIRALLQADPRSRYDVCVLDKMPERIGTRANPFLALDVALNPSGAYQTRLFGDWEAFYSEKRSSSTRRRDRTKRKKLAESGEVAMVTPVQSAAVAENLASLISQKSAAFARMGVADIFARPGWREFFEAIAQRPITHVSGLKVGEVFAATNLGLVFRGVYYHVLASYDDGPLSRFGPGAAHLHELMAYAIAQGCTTFDFTIGDEPYKRDWCDGELRLYDLTEAATARGWLIATAASTSQRAKRAIKRSKWLWPLVTRLRAAVATVRGRPQRDTQPASSAEA